MPPYSLALRILKKKIAYSEVNKILNYYYANGPEISTYYSNLHTKREL